LIVVLPHEATKIEWPARGKCGERDGKCRRNVPEKEQLSDEAIARSPAEIEDERLKAASAAMPNHIHPRGSSRMVASIRSAEARLTSICLMSIGLLPSST
jgi:hypothetical protein